MVRKDTSSLVDRPTLFGETTITGRGQVTLPARGLRAMEWKTGDHLLVQRLGTDMVVLMRRPTNWAKEFAGKLTHVFGDHEAVLEYVRGERASWDDEQRVDRDT